MGTEADRADVVGSRLRSQLLAGKPARSVGAVVERLLAVQAQDPRGFRLTIRSRSRGLTASDVERALTDDRSVIVSWLNRGTLHLVSADDYWWLQQLTTPRMVTTNQRRLRQEGVSAMQADHGVAIVTEAVSAHGPQTREQLRAALEAAGIPTAGQALVHLLVAASLRGHVVRGPVVGHELAFVAVDTWLGPGPSPLDPDDALAQLARRYLTGHGPAAPADLAMWAGITLAGARCGFAAIADEVRPFGDGLVALADAPRPAPLPLPRLLGPFDPLLHGWKSRVPFVGTHAGVVTTNGIFRPVALVDGRVVATWRLAGGRLTVTPLEPITAGDVDALLADATRVLRFLELPPRRAVVTLDR